MKISANLANIFEQALFLDNRQIFQSNPARQRTAAKSRAMLSR